MLTRYTDRIYLCFDSDNAGRNAAWSAGKLFLHTGYDARIVRLPSGKDPDDWARAQGEAAPQAWQELLAGGVGVVRYWLDHQQAMHPQADPTTQREWVVQLRGLYQGVPDELLRQEIQREVASALRLGGQEVAGLLGAQGVAAARSSPGQVSPYQQSRLQAQQKALLQGSQPLEDELARRLLTSEAFRRRCLSLASVPDEPLYDLNCLASPPVRMLFLALVGGADAAALPYDEAHAAYSAELLTRHEPLQESDDQLLTSIANAYFKRRVDDLLAAHGQAEAAGDADAALLLALQVQQLKKRIRPLASLGIS
jgi:hypothetical protein